MRLRDMLKKRTANSSAEEVELRGRRVYVKPAKARFILDAAQNYDPESEETGDEQFLIDLMRESVIDEDGNRAFGGDPLDELDWQEFNRLRDIVLRWNSFGGEAEKN